MFNLMCLLTMSQFLWFLRRFSRSVGGCVLSTGGPRKDPRHTVQVSFLRRFIRVAAVCSSQRGDNYCNAGRPESVAMAIPKRPGKERHLDVTSGMMFLRESAMTSQRVRELGPPFVAPRRAVLRPCVGSAKSRLKSCVQRLAGFFTIRRLLLHHTFRFTLFGQPSIGWWRWRWRMCGRHLVGAAPKSFFKAIP